jgi:hypothetical protein
MLRRALFIPNASRACVMFVTAQTFLTYRRIVTKKE